MAATEKRRQWILGGALTLTLCAVAWVNQFEGVDAEANIVSEPHIAAPHDNTTVTEKTHDSRLPQTVRYRDSAPDIFTTPAPPPPPPMQQESVIPTAPPLPFTYLGRAVENGDEVIFLTNAQQNYMARSGDLLENSYRIDAIGEDQVRFNYLPLNITQILEIGGVQ